MVLIVGISGASGAIYGVKLLKALSGNEDVETHLIITRYGEKTIRHETDYRVRDIKKMADFVYDIENVGASIASGSFKRDGMVISPCSVKTMSALANSYDENLLIRAGDVNLKEKKPLILLLRETPLHLGHLRNMVRLTEMGAVIFPPVPVFYNKPETIDDIVNNTIGRVLDMFDVEQNLSPMWHGLGSDFI